MVRALRTSGCQIGAQRTKNARRKPPTGISICGHLHSSDSRAQGPMLCCSSISSNDFVASWIHIERPCRQCVVRLRLCYMRMAVPAGCLRKRRFLWSTRPPRITHGALEIRMSCSDNGTGSRADITGAPFEAFHSQSPVYLVQELESLRLEDSIVRPSVVPSFSKASQPMPFVLRIDTGDTRCVMRRIQTN
jgi:hypothetical protein